MELNTIRLDGPAAPSATVVLLRDAGHDLEVFLLRRHGQSEVLGGAYVFPGGKADPEDLGWVERLDRRPEELHARLGEPELAPEQAAALYVTAIREVFEETGVLFADVTPAQAASAWAELRAGPRFDELFEGSGLTLQAGALQPWSRWITPTLSSVGRKRFDARFFVATVPPGQEPRHDAHEATESLWLAPRAALRQYWEGRIEMAPPQIMSLTHLARHRSVVSVLAAAAQRRPPCIRPEPRDVDGVRVLCYPGDPWHSESQQQLPGPRACAGATSASSPTRACPSCSGTDPGRGLPQAGPSTAYSGSRARPATARRRAHSNPSKPAGFRVMTTGIGLFRRPQAMSENIVQWPGGFPAE